MVANIFSSCGLTLCCGVYIVGVSINPAAVRATYKGVNMESVYIDNVDMSRVSVGELDNLRPFTVCQFVKTSRGVESSQVAVVGSVAEGVTVARALLLGSGYLFTSRGATAVGYVVYNRDEVTTLVGYHGADNAALFGDVIPYEVTTWDFANAITDGTNLLCMRCAEVCEVYLITSGAVWPVLSSSGYCDECGGDFHK